MLVYFLRVAHFPDGETTHLHPLVLAADLVGSERDVLHITGDNHILDTWGAEEPESTSLLDDVALPEYNGIVRRANRHKSIVTHGSLPLFVSGTTVIG